MPKSIRVVVFFVCLAVVFSMGCKKGPEAAANAPAADKYADVRETISQYVSLLETCGKEVEAAADADGIAAALNKMNDGMMTVAPKIKSLGEQFPELNDPANIPADLKTLMEKMDAVQPVMMAAMEKANQFASEAVIQAALARFAEIEKLMQ